MMQAFVPLAEPLSAPPAQPAQLRGAQVRESIPAGAAPTAPSAIPLGVLALAAAGGIVVKGSGARKPRRAAGVALRAAEATAADTDVKPFAGGLIGGESAFSSGDYNFDPLGIAERCPQYLAWFREAELKHGRIAMLAWVGLVVPDIVRIPGPEQCYTASVVDAHRACVVLMENGPRKGAELGGPLFQVLLFCGLIEMTTTYPKVLKTGNELTLENAGDYKLGLNFLPKDELKAKEMKLKELKNGRLAMIAFGGAITQAVLSGNGFPWLYASGRPTQPCGLSSSAGAAPARGAGMAGVRSSARVAMRAEGEGGYKMSKAVPFLPMSPALEGYVGEEDGFDPIGMSLAWDIRWLREAELKHARVAMLAVLGWVTTDLGFRVPGEPFQVSTLEAHDAMVKFGSMPQMLVWLGYAELFGFLAIINMMEGKTDRKPGDFGLRALYPKDEKGQYDMQLKELRNGRLAMLAFSGIATAGAFSGKPWPFFDVSVFAESRPRAAAGEGSALCGASRHVAADKRAGAAARRAEASRSLPFLPKPQNLAGYVGEEQEFDPLGFSDTFDMKWLREAELKHGRVCMLATVGFAAQQYITFPGMAPTENALNAVYTETNGLATLVFLAGYIESVTYDGKITMLDMFEGKADKVPGDFNFGAGFLKGKSDKEVYGIKLKELNNGRLAMMAFGGMVHHNLVVNGPLFPIFPDGWTGPQGSWQVESLAGGLVNLTYNSPISGQPL